MVRLTYAVEQLELFDSEFFIGIGYPRKRAQSLMHSLCMTRNLALMLDVSRPSPLAFRHTTNLIVCPHVSFKNPLPGTEVPPRESVETRSVVITRE